MCYRLKPPHQGLVRCPPLPGCLWSATWAWCFTAGEFWGCWFRSFMKHQIWGFQERWAISYHKNHTLNNRFSVLKGFWYIYIYASCMSLCIDIYIYAYIVKYFCDPHRVTGHWLANLAGPPGSLHGFTGHGASTLKSTRWMIEGEMTSLQKWSYMGVS